MKNKKRKKMSKAVFLLPIMAVAFGFIWYGYTQSEFYPVNAGDKAVYGKKENDFAADYTQGFTVHTKVEDNGLIDRRQREVLGGFASAYRNTLAGLERQKTDLYFSDVNGKNYYQNVAAYKLLTAVRKMSFNDLSLKEVSVTYNVQQVNTNGNSATIHITEDNVQTFRHLSQPSESYNINHLFELEQTGGQWLIKSHEQEEDFFLLTQQAWNNATGSTNAEKAQSTLDILIADAQENIDDLKISTGNPPEDIVVRNRDYNRQRAVDYAKQWCNKRNYNDVWLAYDMYGGNCQNFASQCIYAGGIAMDYKGYPESQWKFYSETQNDSQKPKGRSYSWTGVDPFYTYATINRSNGLICQADLALEYAQPGDIIQVGAYGEWRHSLVVTDVLFNADGSLQDIIVASNTADRWNYPLSAYIYTYPRLIHILGQN